MGRIFYLSDPFLFTVIPLFSVNIGLSIKPIPMRLLFLLCGICSFSALQAQAKMVLSSDTLRASHVVQGDTINAVFYFKNTGPEPLVIHQVWPACQCTAPQYPKDTIPVGAIDSITLAFHSAHTEGAFEKYAIVLSNGPEVMLWVKGYVIRTVEAKEAPKSKNISNEKPKS